MPHYQILSVTLSDESQKNDFFSAFKTLRTHCQKNEPGTLICELHSDSLQPRRFSVVKRYLTKDDVDCHIATAAYKNFMSFLETLRTEEKSHVFLHNTGIPAHLAALTAKAEIPAEPLNIRQKKGILVFGGSRPGARASYTAAAEAVGAYIAEKAKVPLVYGGGTAGMMGAAARAVKERGGEVVSVIPQTLIASEANEGEKTFADTVYVTETMSERKSIMFAHSSAVVVLPGGLGTFDELFEVLTLLQLNAYRTKIGLINTDGFFDSFVANLRHMIKEEFLEASAINYFIMGSPEEVMVGLESFAVPSTKPLLWDTRP